MNAEKEKMLAGDWFNAADPDIVLELRRARELLHRLNVTESVDREARLRVLSELLPNAGPGLRIEPPFYCDFGYNIYAGEQVYFNFNCILLDPMPIRIGAYTMFGPNVQIYTASHPLDAMDRRSGREFAKAVSIGKDCWIGGHATVLPGVIIGDRCVVGAGAVVTRDVPDDSVVVGNPARPIVRED